MYCNIKKSISLLLVICLCVIFHIGCSSSGNTVDNSADSSSIIEPTPVEDIKLEINLPEDGIVRLYTDELRNYLSADFEHSYNLVKGATPGCDAQQSYIVFSGKNTKHYIVRVSRTQDFAEYFDRDVYPYSGETQFIVNLRTLIPGEKYFVMAFDANDES